MKPLRCLLSALALLPGLAILLIPSGLHAQDTVCYALVTVPKLEAPIVRFEMAAAKADHFASGQDFFCSTRGARRLIVLGKADMAGKPRAELNKYLPPSLTYRGPWDICDTRISIATARSGEGREAMLTVDAKVMVQGDKVGTFELGNETYFTRYAATSQVPLRPNAWQEVAYWSVDHYCQMLWQYALVKDAPKAAPAPADPELPPLYRLEMIIGTLPDETFAQLPAYTAARRAIIAESLTVHSHKWTAFSVHCLPGQPFSARMALGLVARRGEDADYEASCSSTFTGTLGIQLGSVALKSEFQTPAPKKEDRLLIPLAADLVPGEWHIQELPERPAIYAFGHTPRRHQAMMDVQGNVHGDLVRANAAFYRVVEIKR